MMFTVFQSTYILINCLGQFKSVKLIMWHLLLRIDCIFSDYGCSRELIELTRQNLEENKKKNFILAEISESLKVMANRHRDDKFITSIFLTTFNNFLIPCLANQHLSGKNTSFSISLWDSDVWFVKKILF